MANSNNHLLKEIRFDWNKAEILKILNMPLIDLMWESQTVHRKYNKYDIQLASLFSVKTGGCEENCSYCSQSIYSASKIKSHPQFQVEEVIARAKLAKMRVPIDFVWVGHGEKLEMGNLLMQCCRWLAA